MRCPSCKQAGLRSQVFVPQSGVVTDVAWQPYYDEDGQYHAHDPNTHSFVYRCSQGHRWSSEEPGCPSCGWGAKPAMFL